MFNKTVSNRNSREAEVAYSGAPIDNSQHPQATEGSNSAASEIHHHHHY